ncbi:formate dehydrogenase-O subunit gamma [Serratia rubidaea]|uniref:cytochrome b/b6 domain-containing protein n=1 Tax=Serratia rubidaea TaxID=61652 RepID=UPI0006C73CF6|nr:cytochrome b/b6 domain-containing protein [Serratia rubidaea]MBS0974093.1 cytochrome b/b6 domain-containing protein [Serratia rubidaea]MDC6109511.1 cytochrome b/b6 domain-containing protein [Serratia rubidaea]QPR64086.1 cytochrome b/b6 domain-containing protein [Serratia rubidaea]CAI1154159.1 formate dehydrogenase-O subunit gamma [Serratia rubidaea]CAI1969930.1 formate dehydrogenase-O subunit gamma [Serratia rubidaea]
MKDSLSRPVHRWPVRITHWVNLFAMTCMFMSGWEIYNASPLFDFRFPPAVTLGGWLGGAIGWHLALMWLLALNGLCYLLWSLFSGHFRRDLLPLRLSALRRDIWLALTLRLQHRDGKYNAIQKLMYLGVLVLGLLLVLSGLAIWKPVQLSWLVALFGGFDIARYVHFFAMAAVGLFVIIHLLMVMIVPRTLWAMLSGGKREG